MIPKIIMQTWKTNKVPPKWIPSTIAIKRYLPDWQYTLMTDEMNRDLVSNHFPDFLPYFDAFPYPIQRADAIRYCWLYLYGGIYIDCDLEIVNDLEQILSEDYDCYLLPSSNVNTVYTNAFIACKPGLTIWLDMIEYMKKYIINWEKHWFIMNTTGPMAFTKIIHKNMLKNQFTFKTISFDANPSTLCCTIEYDPNAYLKPLEGSSWVGPLGRFFQFCYCKRKILMFTVTIIICLIILYLK